MMYDHSVDSVWRARAENLEAGLRDVLDWARRADGKAGAAIDLAVATTLPGIAGIVYDRRLSTTPSTATCSLDLSAVPDDLARPLDQYLAETAGYDPALPSDRQRSEAPAKQHSFVLFTAGPGLMERLA